MIIKGTRLPFGLVISATEDEVTDPKWEGINWEDEIKYYGAIGSNRKNAKTLRSSTKVKKQKVKGLKSNKSKNRKEIRKINAEIRAERRLANEEIKVERADKKAKAAKEAALEANRKAKEAEVSGQTGASGMLSASTVGWQAKMAAKKAEKEEKKAETADEKAEKNRAKAVEELQKNLQSVNAGQDRTDLDDEDEKNDANMDKEIAVTDSITPNNFEDIPDAGETYEEGTPWWVWLLIGSLGLSIIGGGIYVIAKVGKK